MNRVVVNLRTTACERARVLSENPICLVRNPHAGTCRRFQLLVAALAKHRSVFELRTLCRRHATRLGIAGGR